MSTIGDIRQGIADALAVIGLRTWPVVPDNPTPPFAIVVPNRITYHRAFANGHGTHEMIVQLVVGRASERAAQLTIDEYLDNTGDRSVRAAIETDPTLGGVCKTSVVAEMTDYSPLAIGDVLYMSAQFTVQVTQ